MAESDRGAPEKTRAYAVLLFGVLVFAGSSILVRFAEDEAPGLAVAVWRTVFAVLFLLPFALARIGPELRRFSARQWTLVGGAGFLLGIHFVTWIESLYHTSVASVTVIFSTSPLFLALLGYVLLRERLAWNAHVSIVVSVLGTALIAFGDAADAAFPRALFGNALALFSCLVFAAYLMIGRVVRQHVSWLAYVFPMYTVVCLTALALAWMQGTPLLGYSPRFFLLCALMALGPQICGHGSLNYAVRFLPAALIGLATLFEPVGASFAAAILFGEVPGWISMLGMSVVLVAVTFVFVPPLLRWNERRRV